MIIGQCNAIGASCQENIKFETHSQPSKGG
jgi:hypothetical protein